MRYSSKAVLLKFRASGQLRERGKNPKTSDLGGRDFKVSVEPVMHLRFGSPCLS